MPPPGRLIPVLALILAFAAGGCSPQENAAAIRARIAQGARWAENHQVADLMGLTTEAFTAMPGHHNARSVKAILLAAFRHYGTFEIRYPRPVVTVTESGKQAKATVYFMIVSKDRPVPGLKKLYDDPQAWLAQAGEKTDLYQLKLDLIKTGGKWLVASTELSGFKGWRF